MLTRYKLLTAALGHHQLGWNGIFVLSGNELMQVLGIAYGFIGVWVFCI